MLLTSNNPNGQDVLNDRLRRYAARYHISGPERNALVAQTITALAEEPEVLLNQPVEKAIATTMHRLFLANKALPQRQQEIDMKLA